MENSCLNFEKHSLKFVICLFLAHGQAHAHLAEGTQEHDGEVMVREYRTQLPEGFSTQLNGPDPENEMHFEDSITGRHVDGNARSFSVTPEQTTPDSRPPANRGSGARNNNAGQPQQQAQQPQAQNQTQQQAANQQQIQNFDLNNINTTCFNLYNQCMEDRVQTATECNADAEGNSGQRQAQSDLSQIGRQLSAASAQSGTGGATFCATMSAVSAAANTSIAGIKFTCNQAQTSCKSSCGDLLTKLNSNQCNRQPSDQMLVTVTPQVARTEATQSREQCNRSAARAAESSQAVARAASDLLTQSQRCIDNQYAGGLAGYCQTNPTSPACMTLSANDCSNPEAARTNPVCVCRANPGHADCRLVAAVNNRAGSLDSSGAGGAQLLKPASGSSSLDFSEQSSMTPGEAGPGGPAASVGGRKNLNPLQDGNGTAPAGGPGRAGYAGDSDQAKIFRGGGGARVNGGGWGNGAAPNGQGAGGGGQGTAANGGQNRGGVDLRAFLPGGSKDPNARNPASMVGIDGITSAYGKSNFQKIADRYFHMSYENAFLPPDYVAPGKVAPGKVAGQKVPGK